MEESKYTASMENLIKHMCMLFVDRRNIPSPEGRGARSMSPLNRAHQLTAISTEMEISGWFSKDQTSCFKMISPIKKTVKGFTGIGPRSGPGS